MYTELIKRSRLYLEYKKKIYSKFKTNVDALEKESRDTSLVHEVLTQSSRSLLMTKKQLQQIIRLLHVQNTVLGGGKHANESQPMNQRLKRQHKQRQQEAHIKQLKFKLQMYTAEGNKAHKRIDQLKFKIQVCQEYLKQNNTLKNVKNKIFNHCQNSLEEKQLKINFLTPQFQGSQNTQEVQINLEEKNANNSNPFKNQLPIIQLIKGFEHLNNHNDSLLSSFNQRDSPQLKNVILSPFGVKESFTVFKQQPYKNSCQDSSSLIQTSSFIANYQQPSGIHKFSGSIKQILNESEIQASTSRNEWIGKNQKYDKFSLIEGQESEIKIPLNISQQEEEKQLNNQSNGSSFEELQNVSDQNIGEGLSFGIKRQKFGLKNEKNSIEHNKDKYSYSIDDTQDFQRKKEPTLSLFAEKKVNFLNTLSKFNQKHLKVHSS